MALEGNETKENWLDEALALEATPKTLRTETVRDFCARHSLPESNYYYHISKKENKAKILEVILNKAKEEAPEVLNTLVEKAKGGDMKAMAIYVDSILRLAKELKLDLTPETIKAINYLVPNGNNPPTNV